jgi:diguanylate cyclase (GGDEF)-like protein
VQWDTAAAEARDRSVDQIDLIVLGMGAGAIVPTAFAIGGWGLTRRWRELLARSRTDEATGLALRSVFQHDLVRQVTEGARPEAHLVLAVFDLNGLPMVNDAFGRRRGDALITSVGATLRRFAADRPTTISGTYRMSGDGFAVILQAATADDALVVADQLRRQIAVDAEPLTANLGLAALDSARCTDAETLLVAADSALHEARSMGGNRVATSGTGTSGLRWDASASVTDELLTALQKEIDGLILKDPGDSPNSLDLRDLP